MTRTGRRTGSRFRWAVGRASTCPFLTRLERARSSTRRQGSSSRASSDGPATRCRRKQRVHRFGVGPDAGSRAWLSGRGAAARRAGRGWANSSCRSRNARRSTTACAFLNSEIASVDRVIAHDALNWPEERRLMSVPGVNLIASTTFLAAVGNIERFPDRRKLVGYLGLDPKVRQSGEAPAAYGHISKQGSAAVRVALVEASWSAVRQPGPLRAFYRRVRARRGHQIAITAAARKLACLFWVLLWRQQDYAFGQPSLTAKKLRCLELMAGA